MNTAMKNIHIQSMVDSEAGSDKGKNHRLLLGEEFVLSSAQSNVETVRKMSSCGHGPGGKQAGMENTASDALSNENNSGLIEL